MNIVQASALHGVVCKTFVQLLEMNGVCNPSVKSHGSLRKLILDADVFEKDLTKRRVVAAKALAVYLYVAVFPCQDVSTNGAELGDAGPIMPLLRAVVRMIQHGCPLYVVLENVSCCRRNTRMFPLWHV